MTLSAGARLGPYEILSFIGAGGMSEVYGAERLWATFSRSIRIS